jgi:hypothetical protein
MARSYLKPQGPQGFGSFSPSSPSSSSSKKASFGSPRSISRQPFPKKSFHVSKRPRPHTLPIRIKHSKMASLATPLKRTRPWDDTGDQPKKHRRRSSGPGMASLFPHSELESCNNLLFSVTSSCIRERENRRSSEPRMNLLFSAVRILY